MNNQKLNFEEFCQMYPGLLEQAREYAQGIIGDTCKLPWHNVT